MRDDMTDRRPRILDFSTSLDDVKWTESLGWPCHAYRVTIPIRTPGRLNIFEETILRLLGNARLDVETLAKRTCLGVSFVKLMCCRLHDLGMITDYNEVDVLGRTHLSQSDEEPLEYDVRIVFRDRISGTLLPIVYGGELRYEELAKWDRKWAEIRKGAKLVKLVLLNDGGRSAPRLPKPSEVLWASNRHKELIHQFSVLRRGGVPCPHTVRVDQMNVDPNPESVFLRCLVVMPAAGGGYRIGDPFGYGYSPSLRRAYEGIRAGGGDAQKLIQGMRKKSHTVRPHSLDKDPEWADAKEAVLNRLADRVGGYHELFDKLKMAERELKRGSGVPRNTDEEADFAYWVHRAAQSLAGALEEALRQVAAKSRPAATEVTLRNRDRSAQENKALLQELAEHLGLDTSGIRGLLRVPPGRVESLRYGGVDLQALLAVTIAAAAEYQEHPLRQLVAGFGGWLLFLSELKSMRDAGAHGQSRAVGSKLPEELREDTYRSIELLLPNLQRDVAEQPTEGVQLKREKAHDERREAITRLEGSFGCLWYGVGTGDADLLIQVEFATHSLRSEATEPVDVIHIINDLASLLQSLVHARQPATNQKLGHAESPKEVARRHAVEAGLLVDGAELPRALATVRQAILNKALRGRSPTLGASLMALLILSPVDRLRELGLASGGFLDLVARTLDLRGHGNRPVFMRAEALLELKDEIYSALSALMEV